MKLSVSLSALLYPPAPPRIECVTTREKNSTGRMPSWTVSASANFSPRSLRIYAYDLLDFAPLVRTATISRLPRSPSPRSSHMFVINSSRIPKPNPADGESSPGYGAWLLSLPHWARNSQPARSTCQRCYTNDRPLGYGRPRRAIARGLHLKQDRRVIVPLSAGEVAKFWQSFRTYRDLLLVGLML